MDATLSRFLKQQVNRLLGPDTRVLVKDSIILVDSPRTYTDKLKVQAKLLEVIREKEEFKSYKIICIDPEHTITNDLKRLKFLATEIL